MKKTLRCLVVFLFIIQALIPADSVLGQENITPMESVEWIDNADEETSETEETEEESIESSESLSQEQSQESLEESSANQEMTGLDVDTSSYAAFVESLTRADSKAFEYVSFVSEGESLTALSHSIFKNGPYYYLTQLFPPFLPTTQVIKSDRNTIETGYLSVEDLMINAADGLNQQPQIYVGTVVEDFYVFAQENYQDLEGMYIEFPVEQLQLANVSLEMFKMEEFISQVLMDWLAEDIVLDSFMETDLGYQVDIVGQAGDLFNQYVDQYRNDYPELEEFLAEYPNGFQGTVMINYENYLLGLGLIAEASDSYAAGSEIYIEYRQPTAIEITEDTVISYEDFVNLVGYDIIAEINAFEASLTADQFVRVEGE